MKTPRWWNSIKATVITRASLACLLFGSSLLPCHPAEIVLRSGDNATIGQRDPQNQYFDDASLADSQTWIHAPVVDQVMNRWHIIEPTKWISTRSDNDIMGNIAVRFRRIFILPQGFSPPQLRLKVHADNWVTCFLNGSPSNPTPFVPQPQDTFAQDENFQDPPEPLDLNGNPLIYDNLPFQAGVNTLYFDLESTDGPYGFDYEITITYDGDPPPGNLPPIAGNDKFSIPQNSVRYPLSVLGNDSDPDGDALGVLDIIGANQSGPTTYDTPSGGVAVLTGQNILYTPGTPSVGFMGKDEFQYSISDGRSGMSQASLIVVVGAPENLTATPGNQSVTLDWDDFPDADHYKIYRSTSPGSSYQHVGTTPPGTPPSSFVDYGPAGGFLSGVVYYYKVSAVVLPSFGGEAESLEAGPVSAILTFVRIEATDPIAAEPGSDTGTFTITRTGSSSGALTVFVTISGTATGGSDYQHWLVPITIQQGFATATITVTPFDDSDVEGNETVILTLDAGPDYSLGSPVSATVIILDDESPPSLPTVTVAATDANAAEAGPDTGQFTISRTGSTAAALTVNFTLGGTAANGGDYQALPTSVSIPAGASSAPVTVTPIDDTLVEGAETVILTLVADPAYTVGTPASTTVSIDDDESPAPLPSMTVAATDANAAEAGPDPGQFTISRTGSTAAALTVNFTLSGTAVNGTDYQTLPTSATILAGSSSVTVTVTPFDDSLVEGDETVILTLDSNPAYIVGSPSSATVIIHDNDLPIVTVVATDLDASETAPDTGEFTITRTGGTSAALTVNYTLGGTAINGSDYLTLPTSVTIPAGASSVAIMVMPIDDTLVEGDETVILTLDSNPAYIVGSPSTTVIIHDNDVPAGALYVGADDWTQGNWSVVDANGNRAYGNQGYKIIGDPNGESYPAYLTVLPPPPQNETLWEDPTADPRGLQKVNSTTDRIAACWYSSSSFTFEVNLTDGQWHQVALYVVDWDTGNTRAETIEVLDAASGAPLATTTPSPVASFYGGRYLVWNIRGHVTFHFTNTGFPNAVVSGLFFDPPAP